MPLRTVAAAHKNPNPRNFPRLVGLLSASAETIEGPRPCDWFDVFVDRQGELVVLLVDAQSGTDSWGGFVTTAIQETRAALLEAEALHTVVNALELQLAAQPSLEVGLLILRFSERDAKVELLNAGMPPVANAGPGARLELYPARSGPVGRRVGEVHPYELLPLTWGGSWLALSDGMLDGSLESDAVATLCAKLDLSARGLALSQSSSEELYDALQSQLSSTRFLRDDATGVLIGADPGARFKSGIESASG